MEASEDEETSSDGVENDVPFAQSELCKDFCILLEKTHLQETARSPKLFKRSSYGSSKLKKNHFLATKLSLRIKHNKRLLKKQQRCGVINCLACKETSHEANKNMKPKIATSKLKLPSVNQRTIQNAVKKEKVLKYHSKQRPNVKIKQNIKKIVKDRRKDIEGKEQVKKINMQDTNGAGHEDDFKIQKKKPVKAKDGAKNKLDILTDEINDKYEQKNDPEETLNVECDTPPCDDDHFMFCDLCNTSHHGECIHHGSMIQITDKPTDENSQMSKARASLPDSLYLQQSSIEDAGTGVFAKEIIPERVRFGPYVGIEHTNKESESSYQWEIIKQKRVSHYIDAQDENSSNWMRFINCARMESEQNLVAMQYRCMIYYHSYKPIKPGQELLVWYGKEFGSTLGLCKVEENSEGSDVADPVRSDPEVIYPRKVMRMSSRRNWCRIDKCLRNFDTKSELELHLQDVHQLTHDRCTDCNLEFDKIEEFQEHIIRKHKRAKSHICRLCKKVFKYNSLLLRHQECHFGFQFMCSSCDRSFCYRASLEDHRKICTGKPRKGYKCSQCDKAFDNNALFRNHHCQMPNQLLEKPNLVCSYKGCGREFNNYKSFANHSKYHGAIKAAPSKQCEICNLDFVYNKSYVKHMKRQHGIDLPYQCRHCDFESRSINEVRTHSKLHYNYASNHNRLRKTESNSINLERTDQSAGEDNFNGEISEFFLSKQLLEDFFRDENSNSLSESISWVDGDPINVKENAVVEFDERSLQSNVLLGQDVTDPQAVQSALHTGEVAESHQEVPQLMDFARLVTELVANEFTPTDHIVSSDNEAVNQWRNPVAAGKTEDASHPCSALVSDVQALGGFSLENHQNLQNEAEILEESEQDFDATAKRRESVDSFATTATNYTSVADNIDFFSHGEASGSLEFPFGAVAAVSKTSETPFLDAVNQSRESFSLMSLMDILAINNDSCVATSTEHATFGKEAISIATEKDNSCEKRKLFVSDAQGSSIVEKNSEGMKPTIETLSFLDEDHGDAVTTMPNSASPVAIHYNDNVSYGFRNSLSPLHEFDDGTAALEKILENADRVSMAHDNEVSDNKASESEGNCDTVCEGEAGGKQSTINDLPFKEAVTTTDNKGSSDDIHDSVSMQGFCFIDRNDSKSHLEVKEARVTNTTGTDNRESISLLEKYKNLNEDHKQFDARIRQISSVDSGFESSSGSKENNEGLNCPDHQIDVNTAETGEMKCLSNESVFEHCDADKYEMDIDVNEKTDVLVKRFSDIFTKGTESSKQQTSSEVICAPVLEKRNESELQIANDGDSETLDKDSTLFGSNVDDGEQTDTATSEINNKGIVSIDELVSKDMVCKAKEPLSYSNNVSKNTLPESNLFVEDFETDSEEESETEEDRLIRIAVLEFMKENIETCDESGLPPSPSKRYKKKSKASGSDVQEQDGIKNGSCGKPMQKLDFNDSNVLNGSNTSPLAVTKASKNEPDNNQGVSDDSENDCSRMNKLIISKAVALGSEETMLKDDKKEITAGPIMNAKRDDTTAKNAIDPSIAENMDGSNDAFGRNAGTSTLAENMNDSTVKNARKSIKNIARNVDRSSDAFGRNTGNSNETSGAAYQPIFHSPIDGVNEDAPVKIAEDKRTYLDSEKQATTQLNSDMKMMEEQNVLSLSDEVLLDIAERAAAESKFSDSLKNVAAKYTEYFDKVKESSKKGSSVESCDILQPSPRKGSSSDTSIASVSNESNLQSPTRVCVASPEKKSDWISSSVQKSPFQRYLDESSEDLLNFSKTMSPVSNYRSFSRSRSRCNDTCSSDTFYPTYSDAKFQAQPNATKTRKDKISDAWKSPIPNRRSYQREIKANRSSKKSSQKSFFRQPILTFDKVPCKEQKKDVRSLKETGVNQRNGDPNEAVSSAVLRTPHPEESACSCDKAPFSNKAEQGGKPADVLGKQSKPLKRKDSSEVNGELNKKIREDHSEGSVHLGRLSETDVSFQNSSGLQPLYDENTSSKTESQRKVEQKLIPDVDVFSNKSALDRDSLTTIDHDTLLLLRVPESPCCQQKETCSSVSDSSSSEEDTELEDKIERKRAYLMLLKKQIAAVKRRIEEKKNRKVQKCKLIKRTGKFNGLKRMLDSPAGRSFLVSNRHGKMAKYKDLPPMSSRLLKRANLRGIHRDISQFKQRKLVIKLNDISQTKSDVVKRRYFCKHCEKSFVLVPVIVAVNRC